ncbi:MAG: MFS transporter [Erysipelotrichaceae bacterium]
MDQNKETVQQYHRAKNWQIGLFALNNLSTNVYMFMMMYVSYYATGIAGLAVVTVSTILTAMRLFDGFTDPIIGYFIDKTDTKFGKFRPFMFAGNMILAVMILILHNTTHLVPESFRLIYFVVIYGIYIIGYTFQTACTKAAQVALTNDPKQRPLFTLFDNVYLMIFQVSWMFYISNILLPKYDNSFTLEFFNDLLIVGIILSAIFMVLAVIGIAKKDRTEFFGTGETTDLKFKDYWPVLKSNRAIQMLVVAASTDKLAMSVAGNSVVSIMLFGILMGNYALSGQISALTMVPNLILIIFGTQFARKFGQKKAFVVSTWVAIITTVMMMALFLFGDPTTISLTSINLMTVAFVVLLILKTGIGAICNGIVIPMIADCADYETSISGRYVPGMMGTLFSFVDKFISSFATTIIGLGLAAIGFTTVMPDANTPLTGGIFWLTIIFFFILPILGYIASIIAMKFYPLNQEKMAEVQTQIAEIKASKA